MIFYNKNYEVTFDDVLFLPNEARFPLEEELKKTNLSVNLAGKIKLKVPIISSPMAGVTEEKMAISLAKMGGLGIIHSFQSFERQLGQVKMVKKMNLPVAATIIGFGDHTIGQVDNLVEAGLDLLVIYTYHSYEKATINIIKKIRKKYPKLAISTGPIATKEGTEAVIKAGADIVNIGIGPGSHCTTRLVTGVGRPQLSAVAECYKEAKKYKASIISEGGVKYSGDIAKAIAFGADAVMIGGLFSGTEEAPGDIFTIDGRQYKNSSGMCSNDCVSLEHLKHKKQNLEKIKTKIKSFILKQKTQSQQIKSELLEEGVAGNILYKGSVTPIFKQLEGGLRRSMWYLGCNNLEEIKKKARVILISPSSNQENIPRI